MKKIFILIGILAFTAQLTHAQKGQVQKEQVITNPETIKSQAPTGQPTIQLSTDKIEYGTIQQNSEPVRSIDVTNKGTQPLLITNCSGSCGCTVPTCPREPIMPGKSAKIQVKYDTSRLGPINKSVTISSNDPATPVKTVILSGNVIEPK